MFALPWDPMPEIQIGDRLPNVRLPRSDGETVRPLRGPHRDAVVVVALHDPGCGACRDYLRALADAAPDFDVWDGRVLAVGDRGDPALQAEVEPGADLLVDEGRAVLDRIGATNGPVTLVADRYGQVFHIQAPGEDDHPIMEPRELVEWLKYLATQCPE